MVSCRKVSCLCLRFKVRRTCWNGLWWSSQVFLTEKNTPLLSPQKNYSQKKRRQVWDGVRAQHRCATQRKTLPHPEAEVGGTLDQWLRKSFASANHCQAQLWPWTGQDGIPAMDKRPWGCHSRSPVATPWMTTLTVKLMEWLLLPVFWLFWNVGAELVPFGWGPWTIGERTQRKMCGSLDK